MLSFAVFFFHQINERHNTTADDAFHSIKIPSVFDFLTLILKLSSNSFDTGYYLLKTNPMANASAKYLPLPILQVSSLNAI
jgi:hypothetical protein